MRNPVTGLSALQPASLPHLSQPGFARTFRPGALTLGLFLPIESFPGLVPTMEQQAERARLAEAIGFAALWLRDIPLADPSFGDLGQIHDPFVYLGYLAGQTDRIALATGAIAIPLRHPLHLAKQAASVDQLSGGRLLLGIASGDRPVEFPAFGIDGERRDEIFREHLDVFRQALGGGSAPIHWSTGSLTGADVLPKPVADRIPILVTGASRQSLGWIAAHAEGWVTYPRPLVQQAEVIESWYREVRTHCGDSFKPLTQSLYLDLAEDPDELPRPIHLGLRLGRRPLVQYLERLRAVGVNHVTFNLRLSQRPVPDVLEELAREVLPRFPAHATR